MDSPDSRLIVEPIETLFVEEPALTKVPGCPNSFVWRKTEYKILKKLAEWHDYKRRGRMAKNMRPSHAIIAAVKGSWGVGIDYFLVETVGNRYFLISYDRSPKGSDERKGAWYLEREYFSLSGLKIDGE